MSNYTPEFIARFWSKVNRTNNPDECWLWNAGTNGRYGLIYHNGKNAKAHRVAYELTNGTIPDKINVLHSCDNPPCVNPHHLFTGTTLDNNRDKESKGRGNHPKGAQHGSSVFTDDQIADIRARYASGATLKAIATMYNVHFTTIHCIVKHKHYAAK